MSSHMEFNTTHPRYSPLWELLALLPRHGKYATVAQLADDLGLESQAEVTALARRAAEQGIEVNRFTVRGVGRCMAVSVASWPRVRQLAAEYYDAVYGGMVAA